MPSRVFSALACVALVASASACDGPKRVLVSTWRLERAGAEPALVTLPGALDGKLPRHDSSYTLRATVSVDPAWRGEALSFVVPAFDGLLRCRADGEPVAAAGLEAPRVYRQPGPHRFTIPAEASADGTLDLELEVDHRWTASAWFGAAPRLMPLGQADLLTWTVWAFNLVAAACALLALFQIGMTSTTVYLTDRSRRPYLLFGIQALAAQSYPLFILGVTQLALGRFDVTVLGLLLLFAMTVSVYFSHAFFNLPRPSPWFWRAAALAASPAVLAPGGFDTLRSLGVTTIPYLAVVAGYQVAKCVSIYRTSVGDRRSAGYLLLSWIGLALAAIPDFVVWTGLADPLHGVRTATVGLGLFAFWLSLLFSHRHTKTLAESDEKGRQLADRVDELERNKNEIEQLNVELRRQLSDKSAQIYAALTLGKDRPGEAPRVDAGDVIDERYRIVRRLGAGGMGEVFEVVRVLDGKHLALKLTHDLGGAALARLAREAQVALSVTHENVVRVVDVDVASAGFLYIVMELVEGAPLRASARAEHDLGWAIAVLRQVARGLAALHAAGIVHRDLKPANVLIAEATDGGLRVKISDFGISLGSEALAETAEHTRADTPLVIAAGANPTVSVRAAGAAAPALAADARACAPETTAATAAIPNPPVLPAVPALRSFGSPTPPSRPSGPGSPLTRTGFLPGTPAYIAPELVRGRSHISPAADVFAFGVMAFELATGQRPFAEPPVLAMLAGRIPTWPKPLAESDPSLPPGLAELIDRCLSPQPEARPTSEQISAQLAALDGEPRR